MVAKRKTFAKRRSYRKKMYKTRSKGVNILQVVSSAANDPNKKQFIQGLLDAYAPGATGIWGNCAYRVLEGTDLVDYVRAAYSGVDNLKLTRLSVLGEHPLRGSMIIAYRQSATDQLRILSGGTYVRGIFQFKNAELPTSLILIGQSDCSFRLRLSYKPDLVKSIL